MLLSTRKGGPPPAPAAAPAAKPRPSDDLLAGKVLKRRTVATPAAKGAGAGAGAGDAPPKDGAEAGDEADDLLANGKRARVPRLTFKESHLISKAGLWKLYDEGSRLQLSRKPGHEARDLSIITGAYKMWATQLFPRLHSSAVLLRCREWSGRGLIKGVLSTLRTEVELRRAREGAMPSEAAYLELTGAARAAAEAEVEKRKKKKLEGGEEEGEGEDGDFADPDARDVLMHEEGDDGIRVLNPAEAALAAARVLAAAAEQDAAEARRGPVLPRRTAPTVPHKSGGKVAARARALAAAADLSSSSEEAEASSSEGGAGAPRAVQEEEVEGWRLAQQQQRLQRQQAQAQAQAQALAQQQAQAPPTQPKGRGLKRKGGARSSSGSSSSSSSSSGDGDAVARAAVGGGNRQETLEAPGSFVEGGAGAGAGAFSQRMGGGGARGRVIVDSDDE